MDSGLFILKVLILSAAISVAIKYGGPWLTLAPSTATALVMVFLPSLLLGGLLLTQRRGDRP